MKILKYQLTVVDDPQPIQIPSGVETKHLTFTRNGLFREPNWMFIGTVSTHGAQFVAHIFEIDEGTEAINNLLHTSIE